ncbi:phosphatidylserine decarboxylase [Alkalihalobacillus sp. 1P02AB]|uniref:phosphatidylserine decarboxylase n=1 Tax=Alkalihalobacillus sp. 1P02AB TaxID=3132260 RepID=UPI0039A6419C
MKQRIFRTFVELSNSKLQSNMLKKFAQSKMSKFIIPQFAKTFQINIAEAAKPIGEYKSLHQFFIRSLADGSRTVEAKEDVIVSPVDGKIATFGVLNEQSEFMVKGQTYSLTDMLGDKREAKRYVGGQFIIFYLSPKDYHRIHSPVAGHIKRQWRLGGRSYPVNEMGLKYGKKPLSHNYRLLTELEVEGKSMVVVKVGAMNINSIELTHDHTQLKKGEEIGYFSFGSTVILLFKPNFLTFDSIHENQNIKMGEKIAQKSQA